MAKSESCTRLKYSEEGIDRISSLPEGLHSKILSLLPTENAVATSILSKRWKFIWTCITTLIFKDQCFSIIYNQKFTQFVNSVLVQLNPSSIHNFTLRYLTDSSDSLKMQSLVRAAIQLTILKLELHLVLVLPKPMELPCNLFNCKTLAVLKLTGDIHFNVAAAASASICFPNLLTLHLSGFTIASNCSVSFPCLKDLRLDSGIYGNEESVHKLFASCPVLDSLRLSSGYSSGSANVQVFIISIPSLRSLKINSYCHEFIYTHKCQEYKIQIDTPALEYLDLYNNSLCEYFTLNNLSCLLNAIVMFCFDQSSDVDLDSIRKTEENISKFIGGFVHVTFLSISGRLLKAIGSISENIAPVFSNLKRLKIDQHSCGDWSFVITNMLERTDNLEHLIVTGYGCCGSHESWWMEPLSVPMCLLRRVTTISLMDIGDCSSQFEMTRYFLKNAQILEVLIIGISGSPEEKFQLMQKISMIPRGSRACHIEFI